jgi:hypothetical protein
MGSAPSVKTSGANFVEKIREPLALGQPEEQTDNWDDDFEEGISFTKIQGVFVGFCLLYEISETIGPVVSTGEIVSRGRKTRG